MRDESTYSLSVEQSPVGKSVTTARASGLADVDALTTSPLVNRALGHFIQTSFNSIRMHRV